MTTDKHETLISFPASRPVCRCTGLALRSSPCFWPGPPPRNDGTIAYDPDAASVYMFGGQANSNLNDLWQYSLNTQSWRSLTPVGPLPPTRLGHTLVLDESKRRLILFGGQGSGFFSDVWAFDLKSESWAQLGIDNAGPSRR